MSRLMKNKSGSRMTKVPSCQDSSNINYQRPLQLSSNNNAICVLPPQTSRSKTSGQRETGIIEKLLHSSGYIQCCDRELTLIFNYADILERVNDLKIGDNVTFEIETDKRTNKPVAVSVSKAKTISYEIISDERMVGTVLIEANNVSNKNSNNMCTDGFGQVTFERSGECFFLPYSAEDMDETVDLKCGDVVSFFIATDKKNGLMHARKIQLVRPPAPSRCQGVVCSMRETYGFIERSDVVKEIFFHFTEYQGDISELSLGDDVEFDIDVKQGKEYAVRVSLLPPGTVIFEDISLTSMRGRVKRTLKSGQCRRQSDPLSGRITYETIDGSHELPFGDKDQVGEYTLFEGDIVEFNISTDRRDRLQRATNVKLIEDTFKISRECRETGIVAMLNKGYGFITCLDRDSRMFFHFSEMMEPDTILQLEDELEFTVIQDPSNPDKPLAIRIKPLGRGTATIAEHSETKYVGYIEREPAAHKTPNKNKADELGNISYEHDGKKNTIIYHPLPNVNGFTMPKCGDKVEFNVSTLVRNGRQSAVNIRVLERNPQTRYRGFVAAIKDTYGFIENEDHEKEVFFHFSSFEGDANSLDMGDEVEYTVTRKGTKYSAENIRRLPKGTVAPEDIHPGLYEGVIIRPMRIVDPDQEQYWGVVQEGTEENPNAKTYPYGITGLADKRDFLQSHDVVRYQLCTVRDTGKVMATNIAGKRKYLRARVDSVKGQYGFIDYEATEGRKLFFHMTEVHDNAHIQAGDEVEFVVVRNQRNGRYAAVSVRKLSSESRCGYNAAPRRLRSNDDMGPRVVMLRSPHGPKENANFVSHPAAKKLIGGVA